MILNIINTIGAFASIVGLIIEIIKNINTKKKSNLSVGNLAVAFLLDK